MNEREVAPITGRMECRRGLGDVLADDRHVADATVTEPELVVRETDTVRVVRDLIATAALAPFVGAELFPGPSMQDDDALASVIRATPTSYAHATGTCRMGPSAKTSVVDKTNYEAYEVSAERRPCPNLDSMLPK